MPIFDDEHGHLVYIELEENSSGERIINIAPSDEAHFVLRLGNIDDFIHILIKLKREL